MEDVISDINKWRAKEDKSIGLATVIQTWGSAPRKVGAKMALMADGSMSGSVSGGCVEGAVFDTGVEVLETGRPELLHFGVADETAWEVGLACGGTIEVFVEPLDTETHEFLHALISEEQAVASITIIRGPEERLGQKLSISRDGRELGTVGSELHDLAIEAAQVATHSQRVQLTEEIEVFVDVFRPAPTLVMVGGVHIAIGLTSIAKTLGYRTIVIDPRRAFGSENRFPHVDQLIQAWPDKAFSQIELTPETAVAMLTHDPKIDDPALDVVLKSPAFYVGALGSRRTHAKRKQRLSDRGFSEEHIDRIHGPIGLDIGASTPEEIGLSIMAEIVRAQRDS
jgi:xanthine dehydrogenase accessory factor